MNKYSHAIAAGLFLLPMPLAASPLLMDINGTFGQIAMDRNDDGFTGAVELPFEINFYGQAYNSLYVNNNGNVTFSSGLSSFTPFDLGDLGQAMIAPFWADVDTRNELSGDVYIGSFSSGVVSVTWDNVGFFPSRADKVNSFQLNIYKVGDAGDFDIEFRYDKLQWTTGDASSGVDGLGGTPAVAGFTDGNDVVVMQTGSLSAGALNWDDDSNLDPAEAGRWVYNIRNDSPPPPQGSTPGNPFFPNGGSPEEGYTFTFDVDPETVYFYDPPVATGYDFLITGANVTSATFSTLLDDADGYQLYDLSWNYLGDVAVGGTFNFLTPLSGFYLRGIDPANMLQPGDPTVFVFGFAYDQGGTVTVHQTPFIEDYEPTAPVPEPASWMMMIGGFAVVGSAMRRRKVTLRFA